MARLETLAVSAAAGDLMPALAPALAQSLADVRGLDCTPEVSAPAWECLSDLLCSTDAQAAQVIPPLHPLFLLWRPRCSTPCTCYSRAWYQMLRPYGAPPMHCSLLCLRSKSAMILVISWLQLAESWLLRLLMAAAERQMAAQEHERPEHNGTPLQGMALLPALQENNSLGNEGSTDIGYRDQPHLALLLQHAMSQASSAANTAARLARAARRLLLLVKLRCALPQHAWSMELRHVPVSPPYLRSLRGPGRNICTPRWAPLPVLAACSGFPWRLSHSPPHFMVSMIALACCVVFDASELPLQSLT